MPVATALLLNWKRPEYLARIIESIKSQTVPTEIFLWNNNIEDTTKYPVDFQINSSKNLKCWPRWLMGSLASSEYVFSLDDDVLMSDPDTLSKCIAFLEKLPEASRHSVIVGFTGVALDIGKTYWTSRHLNVSGERQFVSVVKGRFMFLSKRLLNRVTLEFETEDDIKVSSFASFGALPTELLGSLTSLPEGKEGLCFQPGQAEKRIKATDRYFNGRNI